VPSVLLYPRPQIRSPGSGCSSSTYGSNGELGAIFGPADLGCPSTALTSTVRAVTESAEGVWVATGADKAAATAATLMQSRLQRTLMQLGIQPFTYRSRRRMMLMTADTRQCMGKRTCVPLPDTHENHTAENLRSLAGYTKEQCARGWLA